MSGRGVRDAALMMMRRAPERTLSEIAADLSKIFRKKVTKNMVVGWRHRAGLCGPPRRQSLGSKARARIEFGLMLGLSPSQISAALGHCRQSTNTSMRRLCLTASR